MYRKHIYPLYAWYSGLGLYGGPSLEEVYDLLYQLGLAAKSTGFFHLAYTVRLAAWEPQRLLDPDWLYPETARHYRTDPEMVEKDIRKLSSLAWKRAPDRLCRMAGTPLTRALPPVQFLKILAGHLRSGGAA